ncbi:hydroxypyruvate isomerase family protein [Marinospirillum perlucidum]|uniref:hydroxypyruvate isomerase family protein n=1 Tax=Marinospirillum perlucidum TaxID=1982602 RepID=UPI000DF2E9C5|nr:TIM barrel protein [Marinospirillum perlucidum]
MKLAANISMLFSDLAMLDRPAAAKEKGFTGIEVQFPYAQSPEDWLQALEKAGLPLVLINLPAGDFMQGGRGLACHPDREEAFDQALEASLPYIEQLKPQIVNVLAGRLGAQDSPQTCEQQLVKNLKKVTQRLQDHSITVTCEPINNLDQPGYLTPRVNDWARVAQAVEADNFGLQLDIYHAARMQEDIPQLLTDFAEQLAHLQFADVPGRGAPGTGSLAFNDYWQQLQASGYQGWIAAEFSGNYQDAFTWVPLIHGAFQQ